MKRPDILDIFVSKVPSNLHCTVNNILDLNSDHSSVILNFDATPQTHSVSYSLFSQSTNHYIFHDIIAQKVNLLIKLKSEHDIDEAINNLSKLIHSAASLSNTLTNSKHSMQNQTLLPEQIRSLIVEKRRARAAYQRTRLPSHKSVYNKLANSLKKTLAKNKADALVQKLTNLSNSDGSLWKETKNLLRLKTPSTPLKKPDHTLAFSDSDKAKALKAHLQEIFQPHHNIFIPQCIDEVKAELDLPSTSNHIEKYFTPNEVKQSIQKYSLKKSPGYDLITAEVARCLPKKPNTPNTLNSQLKMYRLKII